MRTILVCIAVTIASVITAITLTALPALLMKMLGKDSNKTRVFDQLFLSIGVEPNTTSILTFLLIGILLQNLILGAANIYAGFTKAKIVKDLRISLLSAIASTEWRFYINRPSGELSASLINEADLAGHGYITGIGILAGAVQTIAYIAASFFISWEIATIAIITSLLLFVLFSKFISISRELGAQDTLLLSQFSAHLTDMSRSIKSLKAMSRASHSQAILDSYTKKMKAVSKKSTTVSELLNTSQEIVLMSAIIFTILFSFQYLSIPLEFAIILVILYIRALKLVGKTQKQLQTFVGNLSGFTRITNYIDVAKNSRENRTGTIKHTITGNIVISRLCFGFTKNLSIKLANATIYHNKLTSIVGRSGTGKTTLVDLICGLYLPTAGQILIDNIPLNDIDIQHWRKQIGYVIQDNALLNTTILENVTLGDTSYSEEQVLTALHKAHAREFIEVLEDGIYTSVGENGSNLSGGQRQRILIARALVHSPRLLILDEATSALDNETENMLSEVFQELRNEITIISISHRPALINASDYVYELRDRKLFNITEEYSK